MCGINGFNYADKELLHRMEKFTQKRGPDANGYYIEEGISLGHNRLSIIDISENAKCISLRCVPVCKWHQVKCSFFLKDR